MIPQTKISYENGPRRSGRLHGCRSSAPGSAGRVVKREPVLRGATTSPFAGAAVLIVEDHADTRELYQEVLQRYGAFVVTASSASRGVAILGQVHVDVVVADVGLPDDVSVLVAAAARRRIPIIGVTAHAEPDKTDKLTVQRGVLEVLLKPVDPFLLCKALARALDRASG